MENLQVKRQKKKVTTTFAVQVRMVSINTNLSYRSAVLRIDASSVQKHATLVDERRILIVIVFDVHRQCGG